MKQHHSAISRRQFFGITGKGGLSLAAAIAAGTSWSFSTQPAAADAPTPLEPTAALQRLLDGNQRFVKQQGIHPDQSRDRLQEVAQAQHPFATLLTCADSRVPPELLFDEGIGDLFDIRIAGNIVTPEVLGSVEYAVVMLGTPLVMVLGHERCGAVTAAVQAETLPGQIGSFVKAIKPALAKVKPQSADAVNQAVIANVEYQIEKLKQNSNILAQRSHDGRLKIVGGRYDLDTGGVTLL